MSQLRFTLSRILPLSLILLLWLGLFGCDGSSDVVNPPERNSYTLTGALVQNLNVDTTGDTSAIAIRLLRNDTVLSGAVITFDDDTLHYNYSTFPIDSVYSFGYSPTPLKPTGTSYALGITDGDRLDGALVVSVPDTFRVSYYTGDSTVPNAGGSEVQIEWTASQYTDGYIVAVVLEDSVNTGYGFAGFVVSQGTEATIPPDAFRDSNDNLVVGTYLIYIYSYTGSPDSAFASQFLPVPFPSQLSDNIDQTNLSGRFGTVVVTKAVPKEVQSL